jgi:hypothetical protein
MQTGVNVGNLLAQQGAAQAGGTLASGAAFGNLIGGIGNIFGQSAGYQQPLMSQASRNGF